MAKYKVECNYFGFSSQGSDLSEAVKQTWQYNRCNRSTPDSEAWYSMKVWDYGYSNSTSPAKIVVHAKTGRAFMGQTPSIPHLSWCPLTEEAVDSLFKNCFCMDYGQNVTSTWPTELGAWIEPGGSADAGCSISTSGFGASYIA
ncbi:MAG: hypothetical protein GY838_13520 [bacterium]|nr:hypothetical protein [bacterium]